MSSPRNARIIALALILSFLLATPATSRSQTPTKPAATDKQKPDYSQEAVVVEQVSTTYRFERDGTGQRDLNLRVKVQTALEPEVVL